MNKKPRRCDGCKACCYTHCVTSWTNNGPTVVTELFRRCRFEGKSGCQIYGNHPPACKAYRCAWLKDELDCKRPDELGLVPDFNELEGVRYLSLMEAWPGAASKQKAREFILKMADKYVVVVAGVGKFIVGGPEGRAGDIEKVGDFVRRHFRITSEKEGVLNG
jgi:hypothetical protein